MEDIRLIFFKGMRPEKIQIWQPILQAFVGIVTLVLGLFIQVRLFVLIRKKRDRGINTLIKAHQSMFIFIYPFVVGYLTISSVVISPHQVLGDIGCHIFNLILIFNFIYFQVRSFFMALFRYLCVVHNGQLACLGQKRLVQIVIAMSFLLPAVITFTTSIPQDTGNGVFVSRCQGRYEKVFDQLTGQDRTIYWCENKGILCQLSRAIFFVTSSNLPEIGLLLTTLVTIYKQTERVSGVLTQTSLTNRKRDNGVMMSISILEWIVELFLNIIVIFYIKLIHGYSEYLNKLSLNVACFAQFSILPLFYLMGDMYYRALVSHHGFFKALWIRLFKSDE